MEMNDVVVASKFVCVSMVTCHDNLTDNNFYE